MHCPRLLVGCVTPECHGKFRDFGPRSGMFGLCSIESEWERSSLDKTLQCGTKPCTSLSNSGRRSLPGYPLRFRNERSSWKRWAVRPSWYFSAKELRSPVGASALQRWIIGRHTASLPCTGSSAWRRSPLSKPPSWGGWYEYFEQVNVVGELVPPSTIIEHHIKSDA